MIADLFLLAVGLEFNYFSSMEHRHINHSMFTTTAIDDIIERGSRTDWAELRDCAASTPAVMLKILRVCAAHSDDPGAQRYHLWRHYAGRRVA